MIGAGAGVIGWIYHPNTAVPQIPASTIQVEFTPDRPARSPMTVRVWLSRDKVGTKWHVTLSIDVASDDLTGSNWTLVAIVPSGVTTLGAPDDPRTGEVSPYSGSQDFVRIAPGSISGGKYGTTLIWDDENSGPLRIQGPNLVASLPEVLVKNYTSAGTSNESSVPRPEVTVERHLSPSEDYAFQSGLPPDQLSQYWWSWKPEVGHVNEATVVDPLEIEARSANIDERSHSDEFKSGIAYGIAAAAFIAAIQEYLNERARRRRKTAADQH
jgi:hypothetical protein